MQLSRSLAHLFEWFGLQLERRSWLSFTIFIALYLFITMTIATQRIFWYDELFTFNIANYSSLQSLWADLVSFEPNPPLLFLATHTSQSLFGNGTLATRLPEILSYLLMSLCLWSFVNRRLGPIYAWSATLLPLSTLAFHYAFEARPYGLVLGFCGLSLVFWQAAADGRWRPLSLIGLSLSLGLALCSHFYGILLFCPIAFGELVRFLKYRRIDWPLAFAIGMGGSFLLPLMPIIKAASKNSGTFWAQVNAKAAMESYPTLLGNVAFPLIGFLILLVLLPLSDYAQRGSDQNKSRRFFEHETAALIGLALLPVVALIGGKLVTHVYVDRYVLSAIPGLSILLVAAVSRLTKNSRLVGSAFAASLFAWFAVYRLGSIPAHAERGKNRGEMGAFLAQACQQDLPIAVSEPFNYMHLMHYSGPDFTKRLVSLNSSKQSVLYTGNDTDEKALLGLSQAVDRFQVIDYQAFIATHPQFYVFGDQRWLKSSLEDQGIRLTLVKRYNNLPIYLAQTGHVH
jgi:hypothetical protein